MLILDTNTLYYATKLSTHSTVDAETILSTIRQYDNVMVSSVSFAEFICKYRKNAGIIRRTCSFMRQYNIGLYENKYIPFKADIIEQVMKIRQKDLDDIYNELLILKSKVESRFATTIFLTVLVSLTIFDCKIDPYNVPQCIFDFFSIIFNDSVRPMVTDMFEISYRNAYKTNNAENIIRHDFYEYLRCIIPVCITLCNHVLLEYEKIQEDEVIDIPKIIGQYLDTNWIKEISIYKRRIDKQTTPSIFIKKRGLLYGKEIDDKHLTNLLNGLKDSFIKTIGISSIEEYIFSIVKNTILNGGAFYKNDINDAMILSNLKSGDKILTFDIPMITHMKKYANIRSEYNESIKMINSILTMK